MDIVLSSACSVVCYNFCCYRCAGDDRAIPRSIDGCTPAYLSAILHASGSLEPGVAVTAMELQKVTDEETGLTSSVYFMKLTFSGQTSCPSAVVFKMLNDVSDLPAYPEKITGKLTGKISSTAQIL